jgi:transposase
MVWEVTGRLDLSSFYDGIKVRGDQAGRAATDPRMLLALWLYATIDGVGSGRELDRRCHCHDAYRWLRGGVPVNYHTLNDFRVANEAALDELLTQILTVLVSQKLVTVKRIAQDGTRVRASAGRKSFRGRDRLEELRDEMAAHVAEVKDPAAMKPSRREREAQARLSRIDQALETLKALEEAKAKQKNKPSKQNPPQASTTDPEARMMRMGDGGMRPGYNVQIAVDIQSRAVVGAEVTSCGSDAQESARMRAQVNERTGQKVHRHLIDGGVREPGPDRGRGDCRCSRVRAGAEGQEGRAGSVRPSIDRRAGSARLASAHGQRPFAGHLSTPGVNGGDGEC